MTINAQPIKYRSIQKLIFNSDTFILPIFFYRKINYRIRNFMRTTPNKISLNILSISY